MSTLTFESITTYPRRTAVRRQTRKPLPLTEPANVQAAIAAIKAKNATGGLRNKRSITALVIVTVLLHAAIITSINRHGPIEPLQSPPPPPLSIDIAPPPPPPVILPKPLPQVAKPLPAPAKPAPSVPLVRSDTPVDNTPSPDAVRVATAPAPPAPPAPAPAERITEPRGFAGYLNNPAPEYPAAALLKGYHGTVILNVHVLASGQADQITVLKTSGQRILDDAAIKTVTNWKFDPAKRGETPIDAFVKVPLNFKLS